MKNMGDAVKYLRFVVVDSLNLSWPDVELAGRQMKGAAALEKVIFSKLSARDDRVQSLARLLKPIHDERKGTDRKQVMKLFDLPFRKDELEEVMKLLG